MDKERNRVMTYDLSAVVVCRAEEEDGFDVVAEGMQLVRGEIEEFHLRPRV